MQSEYEYWCCFLLMVSGFLYLIATNSWILLPSLIAQSWILNAFFDRDCRQSRDCMLVFCQVWIVISLGGSLSVYGYFCYKAQISFDIIGAMFCLCFALCLFMLVEKRKNTQNDMSLPLVV